MSDLVVISILETTSLTDPELINRHATRFRLIGAALGGKIEWLIRFMEGKRPEVMGGEYWNDE